MEIGVAVVGLGFMGRRYVRYLSQMPEAKLVAVCDLDRALAQAVAGEVGARVVFTVEELGAMDDVDAIFVCTPEDRHVAPATAALAHGKAVMIEKPVAHTMAAAREIARAAAESNAPVMVGHLLRFEPRWAAAKRAIDAGDLGNVVSLSARRVGNVLDQQILQGRTTIPLYYGVHDLDILNWFAGVRAKSIYAARRSGVVKAAGYDVDDLYSAIVVYDNGILATAELGWHVPAVAVDAPTAGVVVAGDKGWLRIEQKDAGLEYWTEAPARSVHPTFDVTFWSETHGIPGGALANELRHFLHCVATGDKPIISLADAIEALRMSLAMQESAAVGQAIDLTTWEVDADRTSSV